MRKELEKFLRRLGVVAAAVALLSSSACGKSAEPDRSAAGDKPDRGRASAEWPTFGHDLANSRNQPNESVISPETVSHLKLAWEVEGLKGVTSTPVVVDSVVYVGDYTGKVTAFDAKDGRRIWSTKVDGDVIYGSVALVHGLVVAGDRAGNLTAMRRSDGKVVWSRRADTQRGAIVFGSPVAARDRILVGFGSAENFFPVEDFVFRGNLAAFDPKDGEEIWRTYFTDGRKQGAGVAVWSTPAVDLESGLVFVGTGQHYEPPPGDLSDSVVALRLDSGRIVWAHQYTEGDVRDFAGRGGDGPDADVGAGPNLFQAGERRLVGAGDKAGRYKAIDRLTGREVWSTELTRGGLLGGVEATAAVADGKIFVASNVAHPEYRSPTGESVMFALDASTGRKLWQAEMEGSVYGPPSTAGGVVFGGTDAGWMLAFDSEDGKVLWRHKAKGGVAGGPAIVDGFVYWGYGFYIFRPSPDQTGGLLTFRVR